MDPWDWDNGTVVNKICFDNSLWNDRPQAIRPETTSLAEALRLHDVDGATLLCDVDRASLQENLKIFSLGQMSAIIHAVKVLRIRSVKYLDHQAAQEKFDRQIKDKAGIWSPSRTPVTPEVSDHQLDIGPSIVNGEPLPSVRPGETLAVTQTGVKKRRLQLKKAEPLQSIPVPSSLDSQHAFLGMKKITVQDLFQSTSGVDEESSADELCIHGHNYVPPGQRQFVSRRMKHYLQSEVHVEDHTVDGDSSLPLYGDSGSEADYPASLLDEMDQEVRTAEALHTKTSSKLTAEQIDAVIRSAVEGFERTWQAQKLPEKSKKASKIWHEASSSIRRSNAIDSSRVQIESLEHRLSKQKQALSEGDWNHEAKLRQQCQSLQITVFDIQYQKWLTSLLKSSNPPALPVELASAKRSKVEKERSFDDDEESISSTDEDSMSGFIDIDDIEQMNGRLTGSDSAGLSLDLPLRQGASTKIDDASSRAETDDSVFQDQRPQTGYDSIDLTQDPAEDLEEAYSADDESETQDGDRDACPEEASPDEVLQWDLEMLSLESDRKRLVLKLLYSELDDDLRDQILQRFLDLQLSQSKNEMQRGFGALKRDDSKIPGVEESVLHAILANCKLYACWIAGNHQYYTLRPINQDTIEKGLQGESWEDYYGFMRAVAENNEKLETYAATSPRKRKKNASIDKEAAKIRKNAQKRRVEGDERTKEYQLKLQSSGLVEDTESLMINITAAPGTEPIYINPNIAKIMKPHQVEGVRFMWRELIAAEPRQGCLLAHTMGLGKTLQSITLLLTIAEASRSDNPKVQGQIPSHLRQSRTLLLCPPGLVENWRKEFGLWVQDSSPFGIIYDVQTLKLMTGRARAIHAWFVNGGILIMGYQLFRKLVAERPPRQKDEPPISEAQQNLLDHMRHELIDGPNIVVADEAHVLKNARSSIVGILAKTFRTQSRIALTGSPLSNNLGEYFSMIDFVAPGYLGDREEFVEHFQKPIERGTYKDSTGPEQRLSLKRLRALKKEIEPKVHRRDILVLKNELQPKTEFVLQLGLTSLQREAYVALVDSLRGQMATESAVATTKLFDWMNLIILLCDHPAIFQDRIEQRATGRRRRRSEKQALADVEDAESSKDSAADDEPLSDVLVQKIRTVFSKTVNIHSLDLSHKTQMIQYILRQSKLVDDKVLIFSHQIAMLGFVQNRLIKTMHNVRSAQLDGTTAMSDRVTLSEQFRNGAVDVLLISTRIGQGMNMQCANRVIIVDFAFNPQHEAQAVGRAFRLGQKKPVFVYHLGTAGTYEEVLLHTNVFKEQLAARVVDTKTPQRSAIRADQLLFHPTEAVQQDLEPLKGKDAVLDQILGSDVRSSIRSVQTTETLHLETDEQLTPEEVREMEQESELRKRPRRWMG